jgi:predicted metal-binding membrane protein
MRLGAHCVHCCLGLTVMLLVIGVMELRAMALVTAAISVERFAPGGLRAARWIGAGLVATGLFLTARAALD